jgi:hypothetical protein
MTWRALDRASLFIAALGLSIVAQHLIEAWAR